jgi:hypothetical protein
MVAVEQIELDIDGISNRFISKMLVRGSCRNITRALRNFRFSHFMVRNYISVSSNVMTSRTITLWSSLPFFTVSFFPVNGKLPGEILSRITFIFYI